MRTDLASTLQQASVSFAVASPSSYFNVAAEVVVDTSHQERIRGQQLVVVVVDVIVVVGAGVVVVIVVWECRGQKNLLKSSLTLQLSSTQPSAPYSCWSLPCAHLFFRVC